MDMSNKTIKKLPPMSNRKLKKMLDAIERRSKAEGDRLSCQVCPSSYIPFYKSILWVRIYPTKSVMQLNQANTVVKIDLCRKIFNDVTQEWSVDGSEMVTLYVKEFIWLLTKYQVDAPIEQTCNAWKFDNMTAIAVEPEQTEKVVYIWYPPRTDILSFQELHVTKFELETLRGKLSEYNKLFSPNYGKKIYIRPYYREDLSIW